MKSRKESAKENTSKPSKKKGCFVDEKKKQVERKVTPTNQIRMQKQVHVVKQAAVKRKMLEIVKVGEKVILSI